SWARFCEVVKHRRRFFFAHLGGTDDDRDSYSCGALLHEIATMSERMGLVNTLPSETLLWRARTDIKKGKKVVWTDFGPPPEEFANQSNRMNPAGIPMMYLASSAAGATKETRATSARVGCWTTLRDARILDLRSIPAVPGIFAEATRDATLALSFLNSFVAAITSPVARDDRVHVEYLPSQVVSEFLRGFRFDAGALAGC
uniref:RES family NAD+ phosphorylase n=1 Tax=Paraburkholderia sp. J41 TaxID=2805433 RepID=UPI002AC329C8